MHRRLTFLLFPSLLLVLLIFTDLLPWLRGPAPETSEWYWPYLLRPFLHWWPAIIVGIIFLFVSGWWLHQPPGRWRDVCALLVLSAVMVGLQLSLIYADRAALLAELVDRTLNNLDGGFFAPAADQDDLNATLRAYPDLMPVFFSEHARTHPPGLIIANNRTITLFDHFPDLSRMLAQFVYPGRCTDLWLLERPFSTAAALLIWSVLPLLAAACTIWPGYGLARQWLDVRAARLATLLIAALPALLLFAPKVVQLYPPLVLLLFWALVQGLKTLSRWWLLLVGGLYSLLTFLSLGNLALALPIGLYALLDLWRTDRLHLLNLSKTAVPLIIGGLSLWLTYWLGWGVPPWAIVRTGLGQHYELVTLHRRYDWWLVWNLIDVLVYAGWPLLMGFGLAIGAALVALRTRQLTAVDQLSLSLFALLLVLDMSGSARGEVGRLWLFLMPLFAILAAARLATFLPTPRAWLWAVGMQVAIAVSLGLAWQPVRPVIVVAQQPSVLAETRPETDLQATFMETIATPAAIQLLGVDLPLAAVTPGDILPLTLYWQADRPTMRPYTVFNHLISAEGELVAQQDNWPVNGQWPSTCWQPDEVVADSYLLSLPPDLPDGVYTLVTGFYDARDGTRLPTTEGSDHVSLGQVNVVHNP